MCTFKGGKRRNKYYPRKIVKRKRDGLLFNVLYSYAATVRCVHASYSTVCITNVITQVEMEKKAGCGYVEESWWHDGIT